MLDDKSQAEINSAARITGIIVLALCSGILVFAVIAVMFPQDGGQQGGGQMAAGTLMTYLSCGFAVLETVMCLVVPNMMVRAHRKRIADGTWSLPGGRPHGLQTDAGQLAAVYQTTTIIGCALLEGAAFFAIVAYMMEGQIAALVVAALLLIGVALHFPTGGRLTAWVENQLRIIDDERQMSSGEQMGS